MAFTIKGARVWDREFRFLNHASVTVEDECIVSLREEDVAGEVLDATGLTLLPGLIDVHTHGCVGQDFLTATEEEMQRMKKEYLRHGVTSLFPTLVSATVEEWLGAIERIQNCEFAGIHLEGRYLHPLKRGVHPAGLLAPLNAEELESVLRNIRIPVHVSAAYEMDTDGKFAACAKRWGATLGLAHTMATATEANMAIENGVTSFTHLFNAMPPLHHRNGGAVCTALLGDAWVELIADGVHVSPEMICLAYRCKTPDKVVLVSDSMEATGCPDGKYSIAGTEVFVKNGRAKTADGTLGGSTLRLWDGVRNLMQYTGIPLEKAIACATINPAEMVGIDRNVGSIDKGKRADLLLVDDKMQIRSVISGGVVTNLS